MAKTIYHTKTAETKAVYHTHTDCSEYKKIEAKDLQSRQLCEVCAAKG